MNTKFSHNALIIAREARGLSQQELSEKSGFSQSAISKMEQGILGVSKAEAETFASLLKYPISFFYQEMDIYPTNLHFRKKSSVPARELAKVEAEMNVYRKTIEYLMSSIEISGYFLPSMDDVKNLQPRQVAKYLRTYWSLPKGSIPNLVELVEKKGVVVIAFDFGTDKISGRSIQTKQGMPIIFVNTQMPGDHQRLTVAHELGHIIMHLYSPNIFDVDVEDEAMEFASEFLMPEQEIRPYLTGSLSISTLADLKKYWRVSMQAILYWAQKMGAQSKNQARYLWSQFASKRIKYNEPIEISPEKPSFATRIINTYLKDLQYSIEEISHKVNLEVQEFKDMYGMGNVIRLLR